MWQEYIEEEIERVRSFPDAMWARSEKSDDPIQKYVSAKSALASIDGYKNIQDNIVEGIVNQQLMDVRNSLLGVAVPAILFGIIGVIFFPSPLSMVFGAGAGLTVGSSLALSYTDRAQQLFLPSARKAYTAVENVLDEYTQKFDKLMQHIEDNHFYALKNHPALSEDEDPFLEGRLQKAFARVQAREEAEKKEREKIANAFHEGLLEPLTITQRKPVFINARKPVGSGR